jgi:methionyl-tRNA formyltransferase
MRIVFFGTPEIAYGCLEELLDKGYNVVAAVTGTDKPQGRGYKVDISPVKRLALERGVEVYQPDSLRKPEVWDKLKEYNADIFITCAYGKIFPAQVLSIPPMGCVNVHASLLPAYRGASPIYRAIMNGDKVGGVTIMYMDEGMDTGDIALTKEMEIPRDMDFGSYYNAITSLGRAALTEYLEKAKAGEVVRRKQDHSKATYAPKIEKEETVLDFNDTAENIYNKIRGLSPTPCAYTTLGGKRCKIYKALLGESNCGKQPGDIIKADKTGIEVACNDKSVIITDLQPEGKNKMTAAAFLAGNKLV